jgi:hypothetical protein
MPMAFCIPNRKVPARAAASSRKNATRRALSEWRSRRCARRCQRYRTGRRLVGAPQRERVACVAQRLDGGERLELAAQAADDDVDGARVQLHLVAAQLVQDVVAAEHLARFARQHQQQLELRSGQVHRCALTLHAAGGRVDREPLEVQPCLGAVRAAGAAQHRLQARHQLARLERLGQVVVGTQLQPDDAVHHLAARGEHHDRDVALGANRAAQREAVLLGQHHVEDRRVEALLPQQRQSRAGTQGLDQREAEALDVGGQRLAERLVVVDQQDARHRSIVRGPQPRRHQPRRCCRNSRTRACWRASRLS